MSQKPKTVAWVFGIVHGVLSLGLWLFVFAGLSLPIGPTDAWMPLYVIATAMWFPVCVLNFCRLVPVGSLLFAALLLLNSAGWAIVLRWWLKRRRSLASEA